VHAGPYRELDRTYGTLGRYVLDRGIGASGPIRERYLVSFDETQDEAGLRTEVCWPITDVEVT
jgi:effector-binding domain-containing protein